MIRRRATVLAAALAVLFTAGGAEAASAGKCGGTGGSKTKTLTCPAGQYIIGMSARGGSYVDMVGIRCARFKSNARQDVPGAWMTAGPGGGSVADDTTCGTTQAVSVLHLFTGWYVDNLVSVRCRNKKLGSGFSEIADQDEERSVNVGGNGGHGCSLICPSGEALYQVTVRSGSWIDSIRGSCRP
jgi:hypothetical protein